MRGNRLVLTLYLLFLAAGILALATMGQAELHLSLNGVDPDVLSGEAVRPPEKIVPESSVHGRGGDAFFLWITSLGEWFPFLIIGIVMLFRFGYGVAALAAQGASTIIVQIIKTIVAAPRPLNFFSTHFPELSLPLPEDFIPHWINSFPSGHTTCIFALAVFLIMMTGNRFMKVVFLAIAILVGYSRIYLSQHFALDVVAGSLIGTVCAVSMWYLIPHDRKWYDYSVVKCTMKYLEDKNLLLPLHRNHEKRR